MIRRSKKNSIISGKPGRVLELYTIITADGQLKSGRKGYAVLYKFLKHAMRGAGDLGDSIVGVSVLLAKEPVFIRGQVIDPGPEPAEGDAV